MGKHKGEFHDKKLCPAIGNCVVEDMNALMYGPEEERERLSDEYSKKWHALLVTVADEFDELAKFYKDDYEDLDWKVYEEKRSALVKKAFSDLAFIFDDLTW